MFGETLALALLLSSVNERLIEWFVSPILEKYKVDTMWLRYIAVVTGFAISFLSGVNLFVATVGNPYVGLVLTGLLVGGGSNFVHETFSNAAKRADAYARTE